MKVIGIGCAGGHAIDAMIEAQVEGVEFIAADTDLQALNYSLAPIKIQLGGRLTKGLGAGGNPEIGKRAALEDIEQLSSMLEGADMVFVTTGMGGGTGTGAAPIIASIAKEKGYLTVAAVTKPFAFEGKRRLVQAEAGLRELRSTVDTLIAIPNQRLLSVMGKQTSLRDAFRICDDILRLAIRGISDLITAPGLINLDFADIYAIMAGMGMALLGTGVARGKNRAVKAAQKAISSRLLEDHSIEDARGVLIYITGGPDLTLFEVNEASSIIKEVAHEDAQIIFGAVIDENMQGEIRVTVIATGFEAPEEPTPSVLSMPPKVPVFTRKDIFHEQSTPSVPFTSEVEAAHPFADIVGQDEHMRDILRLVARVADSEATVLITGEGGTGKALIARALHRQSRRAHKPFVAVHCGAIPEQLIDSELFGHEKGAFPGAAERRRGAFERARGGTLFLDEIDNLPLDTQAELLRVLQRGAIERVGGEQPIRIDVRLVAATNADLGELVRTKAFRDDLYYRLNVVPIYVPPLRARKADILRSGPTPSLALQSWHPPLLAQFAEEGLDLRHARQQFERECIRRALEKTHGNPEAAARLLGIPPDVLRGKIEQFAGGGRR